MYLLVAGRRRGKRSGDPRKAFPGQKFSFYISKEEEHPYFRKGERESFPIRPYRAAAAAGIKSFFLLSSLSDIYTKMPPKERCLYFPSRLEEVGIMSSRVAVSGCIFCADSVFALARFLLLYLMFFALQPEKGEVKGGGCLFLVLPAHSCFSGWSKTKLSLFSRRKSEAKFLYKKPEKLVLIHLS